jgi:hypothetical protein
VVYRFGAAGSPTPARVLSGTNTGFVTPAIPLVDTSGNLYVLDNGVGPIFNPTIKIFAPGVSGNVAPVRQILSLGPVTGNSRCSDMIFDPTGQFLVLACGADAYTFPVNTTGTAPTATQEFENESGAGISGMAFDLSGNFYIADTNFNSIFLVGQLPTTPGFHFTGEIGSMDNGTDWPSTLAPLQIVVDNSGTLYAPLWFQNASPGAADNSAELAIWKSSSLCNNCGPSATLVGAPFITHAVAGITIDSAGTIYVVNPFTGLITEFSASTIAAASLATSNATPLRTISDTSTSSTTPIGMAIGP